MMKQSLVLLCLTFLFGFHVSSQELPVKIIAAAYSHDGHYLVAAYNDGVPFNDTTAYVVMFDAIARQPLYRLDIEGNYYRKIAFNATDEWFAWDRGGNLVVAETQTGDIVYAEDLQIATTRVFEWSPNDPALLLSNIAGLLNAGRIPDPAIAVGYPMDGGRIPDIAWHREQDWFATDDIQGNIRIVDAVTQTLVKTYIDPAIGPLNMLDFRPGSLILASTHWPDQLVIRDVMTDQILYQTRISNLRDVEWNRDGTYLAVTSQDGFVTILDAQYQVVGSIEGWEGGLTWSPAGNHLVFGGQDATLYTADVNPDSIMVTPFLETSTATPIPSTPLLLTALCSPDPASVRVWRVRNPNPDPVNFTWDLVGTTQTGSGTVPGGTADTPGEIMFQTTTVDGPITTRIFVGGVQQAVMASTPDTCATPTPTSLSLLRLTSMCSPNPASVRVWRVRNPNAVQALITWQVVGTQQANSLIVPASSDAFFETVTVPGANTTRIFVDGVQQDVKASGTTQCG